MKSTKPLIVTLIISVALNIGLFVLLVFVTSQEDDAVSASPAINPPDSAAEPAAAAQLANSAQLADVEPTSAPSEQSTGEAVQEIMPAATPEPTLLPTLTPTPLPSPTVEPSPTPEPTATPTIEPAPTSTVLQGPPWLQYMNQFRLQAGLPMVTENTEWSEGGRLHSVYMSNTGNISHYEDSSSPYFTRAGLAAGQNGNLATSFISATQYDWAFHYWMSAPFHGLPMLDPQLRAVGFGTHRDANAAIEVAATLDIKQGLQSEPPGDGTYPVLFPKDGGQAWVLRYSLPEFPDARVHCGYGQVSGAPIYVQIGSGDLVPQVSSSVIRQGDRIIEHCTFDETNYINPKPSMQQAGRSILDQRDGIILLPRDPLEVGKTYTVEMVVNGQAINWSFETVAPPPRP